MTPPDPLRRPPAHLPPPSSTLAAGPARPDAPPVPASRDAPADRLPAALNPSGPTPSLVVLWRVTEVCPLNCPFCEYRRSLNRPRRAARAEEVLTFGRLLGSCARETGRPILLSWLGGEPLAWPPLWEVSRRLHRGHSLRLSLTTSGAGLTRALCRRLAEDFAEVTFSLDGAALTHDALRGRPGLHAGLRAAVETLTELKSALGRAPLMRANTVLMRSNLHTLEELGTNLASWGIEELSFNALGGLPGDPFFERERLLPEHIAWLAAALPGLRARLADQGLALRGSDRYLHRLAHTALGLPLPIADCAPGQSFIFIDEAGRASPCSFTSDDYGVPVASLRTVADLRALPARLAQHRHAAPSPACADCHSTQVFGKFAAAPAQRTPVAAMPLSQPESGRG